MAFYRSQGPILDTQGLEKRVAAERAHIYPNEPRVEVILEGADGVPIVVPLKPNERPIPMGDPAFVLNALQRIPRLKKLLGSLLHKGILKDTR